jgi:hypothetical protein
VIARVGILAMFSLAMVGAMMRFTYAFISDDPATNESRTSWGVVYGALWAGICLTLWDLIRQDRALAASDWAALAVAPAGWLTIHALWATLWGSLEIHEARNRGKAPSARSIGLRRTGGRVTVAGLAIVFALMFALGAPQVLVATAVRTGAPAMTLVIAMTVAGWALLVWGGVMLALGVGETHTHNEGRLGTRKTASADIEVSFRDVKDAWREGRWVRDARWRTIFMMFLGAALAAWGLFGIFIVRGPLPVRLRCAGAIGYATIRTVTGFWRA